MLAPTPLKAATQVYASLVPAYDACAAPDRQHSPPLSHVSCSHTPGGGLASDHLTVGTPDANGARASSVSYVKLKPLNGNAGTPADEADVSLTVDVSDVRLQAGLADYTGELRVEPLLRLTDNQNGSVTVPDLPLPVAVGCSATADPAVALELLDRHHSQAVVPGLVPGTPLDLGGSGPRCASMTAAPTATPTPPPATPCS